jgi:hypothetical protein
VLWNVVSFDRHGRRLIVRSGFEVAPGVRTAKSWFPVGRRGLAPRVHRSNCLFHRLQRHEVELVRSLLVQ